MGGCPFVCARVQGSRRLRFGAFSIREGQAPTQRQTGVFRVNCKGAHPRVPAHMRTHNHTNDRGSRLTVSPLLCVRPPKRLPRQNERRADGHRASRPRVPARGASPSQLISRPPRCTCLNAGTRFLRDQAMCANPARCLSDAHVCPQPSGLRLLDPHLTLSDFPGFLQGDTPPLLSLTFSLLLQCIPTARCTARASSGLTAPPICL